MMFNWKILVICIVVIIMCAAQDMELLSRPIRPEKFTSQEQLHDYLQQLKSYHLQNGQSRYGKRFSPSFAESRPEHFAPASRYWRNLFELVKNYEDN